MKKASHERLARGAQQGQDGETPLLCASCETLMRFVPQRALLFDFNELLDFRFNNIRKVNQHFCRDNLVRILRIIRH